MIGVTIDGINYQEGNVFQLRLMPDFDSEYFIPAHLRFINISSELLEPRYIEWINTYQSLNILTQNQIGSISLGGYYKLPRKYVLHTNSFADKIIDQKNDIFSSSKQSENPNYEGNIKGINSINLEQLSDESDILKKNNTFLYGFYVGQGDMMLLITSTKKAYIIDSNIYNVNKQNNLKTRIHEIKEILKGHLMDERRIKGFIITHKHIDHIRGAGNLIDSGEFDIEHFIINLDYIHSTPAVKKLMNSASKYIPNWVNLNSPQILIEGDTKIFFRNPTTITKKAPDINDSSIIMCVQHNDSIMYLTGDASSKIQSIALNGYAKGCCSMLKVSHHGSRSGTNESLIKKVLSVPCKAYISAGTNRSYNHPHSQCINVLQKNRVDFTVSKSIKRTVMYEFNGKSITVK